MSATDLANRTCVPCSGTVPPLPAETVRALLNQVPAWSLSADGQRIGRSWKVLDFATALDFFRRVGDVAEAEDHHPDLHLTNYRDVRIELWTHAANGLTENDFIMAAKIDALDVALKG